MKRTSKFLALAGLAAGLAACGGAKAGVAPNGQPEWVAKGAGAFSGEKGKVFYGVASASGIRNAALRRESADQRARASIAETLNTYVQRLHKDFMESTTAGDMSASSEGQHVSNALKTYTEMELSGVSIIDHYLDPTDGTEYALAQLDYNAFSGQMDKMKELNAKVRDMVKSHADQAFDELDKEHKTRMEEKGN